MGRLRGGDGGLQPLLHLLQLVLLALELRQLMEHLPGGDAAVADGGVKLVQGGQRETLEDLVIELRLHERGDVQGLALGGVLQHLPALLDVLLSVGLFEPLFDPVLGGLGLDNVQPVPAGSGLGVGGDDLHHVVGL